MRTDHGWRRRSTRTRCWRRWRCDGNRGRPIQRSISPPGGFRSYSDIDVAVEGITDARTFFQILGEAERMTRFPLDLVQIEKVAPEYAEEIRQYGKVMYEGG